LSRGAPETPEEAPLPAATEPEATKSPGGQEYWFLDGDAEGWDQTNPIADKAEE
jgi:hypothetical protein